MTNPTNRTAARLSLLALAVGGVVVLADRGWLAGGGDGAFNPCLEPLRWRVGQVDARFGLARRQFRGAVEAAVAVWESTTGRRFFRHDSIDGWPVDLVYDRRQAGADERRDRRERLQALDARIEREQRVHDYQQNEYARERERYERRAAEVRKAIRSHNATVARWNARGGAPAPEHRRIQERAAEIERLRSDVDRLQGSLEERRRRLKAEAEKIRRMIEEFNALAREYGRAPSERVKSGSFQATVVTRGGRTTRADERVRIFHFNDRAELRRVLVHELGHALGLSHVADSAAIMHEKYDSEDVRRPLRLRDADIGALIERCGVDIWEETG